MAAVGALAWTPRRRRGVDGGAEGECALEVGAPGVRRPRCRRYGYEARGGPDGACSESLGPGAAVFLARGLRAMGRPNR